MPTQDPSPWLARLVPTTGSLPIIAGLAALYFSAGKLGLQLAVVHPSATAVWPGTGIALAAILLFRYGVWPGIFLGAFAVNLITAGSILSSLGIATGNTLEALAGAYLVMRFANGRRVFDRAEDIFKFLLFACVLATVISASLGTASVFLTGLNRGVQPGPFWLTWWLGDMAGAVVVAPCFLVWSSQTSRHKSKRPVMLQGIAFVSLLLVGILVFSDFILPGARDYPLKFICIPFVVWVAFELQPRSAALAILSFVAAALASALHASHGALIPNEPLLVMQVFFSVAALTSLSGICRRDGTQSASADARESKD